MKAMIFAAGLGVRLKPHTLTKPKALVPLKGKPMLVWVAEKLIATGVTDIVVNIHHHGDALETFIRHLNYPGVRFHTSDEMAKLLDTGGGLKKAAGLLQGDEAICLYNSDVLCDINLADMLRFHNKHQPLATLAVTRRASSRHFLWLDGKLAGWENTTTGQKILCRDLANRQTKAMAFSGIHLVEPTLLPLITEGGRFSIRQLYLRLAKDYDLMAYEHDARYWADIGTPEKLEHAARLLEQYPERFQ